MTGTFARAGDVQLLQYEHGESAFAPAPAVVRHGYVSEAEADLIQDCIAGDHRAWETLIRRYQQRVYNVAYHMTQDADRANDLAQEAFLQVIRSLHRFRGEASLSTWIHGLTIRVCLHHLRKERRRQSDSWEDVAPGRPEPAGREGRPEDEVVRDQVQREVRLAISQLPLKFRTVMVLHGLGGMTYEETAAALGLPVNTVKTRVFRAKARLRASLQHLVGDDLDAL
ncbi:MAG: sigma-70 family RNA polymerase sigma factor [Armatimonadetes bacterium]|nr:sigma-70 family RNA polymerase sigma factor [Armatimonadota bacterium]